jgi:indolepyruvate ferredoxin oxidoreductase alpha subunit
LNQLDSEAQKIVAKYDDVYAEWAPNEKVAVEVAMGAAYAGARAMATMKHVGLNVAADTFMTAAYTGVRAGLVVVSADDPGIHSSQNEQENRLLARFAGVPMLEPPIARRRATSRLSLRLSSASTSPC